MPVIPTGIPAYQIRPPPLTTTSDKGEPSSNILTDTRRIFDLIDDERHLTAHTLLVSVQKRMQEWNDKRHLEQQQQQDKDVNNKSACKMMILPGALSKQLSKLTSHHHHSSAGAGAGAGGYNSSSDDNSSSVASIHEPKEQQPQQPQLQQQQQFSAAQEILQNRHEQITRLEVSRDASTCYTSLTKWRMKKS
jgi:hypothetical protein